VTTSRAGQVRDVVVVGGGHNGLACAAYLAKAGLDVVVAERRPVLGGAAVTEEPWPGYRVSSASYVVSLLPPRIVSELGLERHGYQVSIVTPDYFVPFPDGSGLTLWGETERDAAEMAKFPAADADSYVEFDRYFGRVAHLLRTCGSSCRRTSRPAISRSGWRPRIGPAHRGAGPARHRDPVRAARGQHLPGRDEPGPDVLSDIRRERLRARLRP
jgi:phytoene dehydrogenase-like protein